MIEMLFSLNIMDIGAVFYVVVVGAFIYLSPNEDILGDDRVYRLPKKVVVGKSEKKDWRMAFQGHWDLVSRHNLDQAMMVQGANYIQRSFVSALGHRSIITFADDDPDQMISVNMTGLPPSVYSLTPNKTENTMFQGAHCTVDIKWNEEDRTLEKNNYCPTFRGGQIITMTRNMLPDGTQRVQVACKMMDDKMSSSNYVWWMILKRTN